MSENYLTIKEVADRLGYNPKSIQRYCRMKAIPCVKINRSVRIPEKWVIKNIPVIEDLIQADQLETETEAELNIKEVKEDMSKKQTNENETTEIVTNKPKVKPFVPNPKKAKKVKEVKQTESENEDEYEDESQLDTDDDSFMDDSDNDSGDQDFLSDYKGIGNW